MKRPKISSNGFTLIELMLVVAIIGVLSAIALPKYADLVIKSKEASVKGTLGALRSAISIYYSNNEGQFPESAAYLKSVLTTGQYLREIPYARVPPPANHAESNAVIGVMVDNGQWYYGGVPDGHAAISCTHQDIKGSVWSGW